MNYQLAKKLKDAKFPKSEELFIGATFYPYPESNERVWTEDSEPSKINIQEVVRTPTLSELIEACGNGLCLAHYPTEWVAVIGKKVERGKTHEEAIAKLYLKLNQK